MVCSRVPHLSSSSSSGSACPVVIVIVYVLQPATSALGAQTSNVLRKSRRRFFAIFGFRGPSTRPGTVKKRFRMKNLSREKGRDFREPRAEKIMTSHVLDLPASRRNHDRRPSRRSGPQGPSVRARAPGRLKVGAGRTKPELRGPASWKAHGGGGPVTGGPSRPRVPPDAAVHRKPSSPPPRETSRSDRSDRHPPVLSRLCIEGEKKNKKKKTPYT